ncbi:MAG TPA: ORF6N domain-containing protein [Steroidobacteraceae bacterium]|nr:ORF6N domain-containing protein [Steroidobacteraceae bacterium]
MAKLYGVKTLRLNEQVRRNARRFPDDFLLKLTNQEFASLRSHFAILKTGRGKHRKYPPLAFTEHGAVTATILGSPLEKSVAVMDADTKRQFKELRAVVFALASPPAKEQ